MGRSLFPGRCVPLLLEMPPYRRPHWRFVLAAVWRKSRLFLRGAALRFCDSRDRHAPAGLQGDEAQGLASALSDALRAVLRAAGDLRQLAGDSGLLTPEETIHA